MKALFLCNYEIYGAAMVTEHINAIVNHSSLDVYVYKDMVKNGGNLDLSLNLDVFDVIIVHYSIFLAVDAYCSTRAKAKLKASKAIKVAFLQDEYRFVNRSIEAMQEAGVSLVFSCVPPASISMVYPPERMGSIRVVNTLTGFASNHLVDIKPKPLAKRRYDISYRGRRYPDWHGSMGREKYEIGDQFRKKARGTGLKLNISSHEKDRVYGNDWVQLIRNSRAVLGVESGASVFDFSGDISSRVETKRALLGRKGTTYDELRAQSFADQENLIDLAQISPRIFEAICLRTACVLFEGSYSGVLLPDEHYIPLKKNFSNFDQVVERLKDQNYLADLVSNAYAQIAVNPDYSYKHFVKSMDEEIYKELRSLSDGDTKFGSETDRKKTARQNSLFESNTEFREFYDKAHPFVQYPYPHTIVSSGTRGGGWLRKFAMFAKRTMPHGMRVRIKSLLR